MTNGEWGVPPPPPWPAEPEPPPPPAPRWRGGRGREDGWAAVGLAVALGGVLVMVAGVLAIAGILGSTPDCEDVSCGEGAMYAASALVVVVPFTSSLLCGVAFVLCLIGLRRGSRRGAGRIVAWVGIAMSATLLALIGVPVVLVVGLGAA